MWSVEYTLFFELSIGMTNEPYIGIGKNNTDPPSLLKFLPSFLISLLARAHYTRHTSFPSFYFTPLLWQWCTSKIKLLKTQWSNSPSDQNQWRHHDLVTRKWNLWIDNVEQVLCYFVNVFQLFSLKFIIDTPPALQWHSIFTHMIHHQKLYTLQMVLAQPIS